VTPAFRAQRAAGLDQQARVGTHAVGVRGLHDRVDVLLDRRRRELLLGVLHAEPAAEIPDRELSELRELGRRSSKRLEAEQLRADVRVQAIERQALDGLQSRDRLACLLEAEAELRVGLAGGDLLVSLTADVRRHAHEHRLALAAVGELALGDEPRQPLDLIELSTTIAATR